MEKLKLNDVRDALECISLAENIGRMTDDELCSINFKNDLGFDDSDFAAFFHRLRIGVSVEERLETVQDLLNTYN